jgi:carboxypeptidase Q
VRSLAPIALACLLFAASADGASDPSATSDPGVASDAHAASDPTAAAGPSDAKYGDIADRLIAAALASDHAYLRLSQLCDGIGNRLSGSKNLDRAVEWAAAAMREDGLDVRLQPVMVPRWVRGRESAVLVEPRRAELAMLGLGRSVGTTPSGITADVVVVRSFEELNALPEQAVRGRMVLFNVPFTTYTETVRYRGRGADSAAARGAVAALVRSVGPTSLRTPHTGGLNYRGKVPRIPAAALSIEDAEMIQRLADRGEHVRVQLRMEARTLPDVLSHNVIGELRGAEAPQEVVVLGGHIDSWDVGAGANDDGGGCVIAMEAVRIIRELGLRPRRTLRVVLWTNEENGQRGAKAYRDSLGAAVAQHVAALESDGGVERPVGFGVRVWHEETDAAGKARHERALERARQIAPLFARIGADQITDNGGGADIDPLMKAGVPGLAHRTVMEHYFDWHHTPADMLDKVDPTELRRNVAVMALMAYVLADMPGRLDDESPTVMPAAKPVGSR